MELFLPWQHRGYLVLLLILVLARGADFLSTWIATPQLLLEANPIARRLGWKWGAATNIVMCLLFAAWPLPAIVVATTSALVAARNFQFAWLMRSLGENDYRAWMTDRLRMTNPHLILFCVAAQTLLTAIVGICVMSFSYHRSGYLLVPFGIGMGILSYAIAVVFYTLLSLWRMRREG